MQLSKSYQLLKFLNKSHSIFSRILFAFAIWVLTFLSSFNLKLANFAAKTIWQDDYKSAMRLANWFVSHSIFSIEITSDPFFDFTSSMNETELLALEKFIEWRFKKKKKFNYFTNKLAILAASAHIELSKNNIGSYQDKLKTYNDFASKALSILPQIKTMKTPYKASSKNRFSMQDASLALAEFAEFAKLINLKYYIISGTFLGVVRENGWLAHDYDIDLGIDNNNLDLEQIKNAIATNENMILRKEDWLIRIIKKDNIPSIERLPTLLKLVHKTGINIDLFIHYQENNKKWHGSIIHKWDNYNFGLAPYKLAGISVLGPDNPNLYLKENYGDWRTPVKEFNSTTGTPNLTIVNNLLSVTLFIKRLGYYREHNQQLNYDRLILQLKKSKLFKSTNDIQLDISRF